MTELYFLAGDLSPSAGPIDDYRSLIWTERYFDCGDFQLTLSSSWFSALETSVFVEIRGRKRLGRIEKIRLDGEKQELTVSGRMAESLLSDRIIPRGTRLSGELSEVILRLVEDNAASRAGERAIPLLKTAACEPFYTPDGILPVKAEVSADGEPLDEWVRDALRAVGAAYRIEPDESGTSLVFSVYRGLDRTQAQNTNDFAVFSTSLATLGAVSYLYDAADSRNFAYIAGEGEGDARVTLTLDLRTSPDEPRRELYVDARDLRSFDGQAEMGGEAYKNLLLARGRKRLEARKCIRELSGVAAESVSDGTAALPVDAAYGLGDLCDIVCDRPAVSWSERITELCFVYEGTGELLIPRFGTSYLDLHAFVRQGFTG